MSVKVEETKKNTFILEITVEAEQVSAAYTRLMKKAGQGMNVPGFRKGKAPQHIIERYVDKDSLKSDVVEQLAYPALLKAYEENSIIPVSRPHMEVVQVEDGKELIFKVTVETKPEVVLGEYTELEVEKKKPEIMEEQLDEELKRRQNMHAKLISVEEGGAMDQDIVTIDFEGFKDGIPFEGGKGENHDLTLGSGTFIPGFEEQLIGVTVGQETEINVRFPEVYQSADLAGQETMFKVTVKGIKRKELAPLDDEFAKDISEFDTLAELREDIKQKMTTAAELKLDNQFRADIIKKAVENAACEIPEGMIQERIDALMEDLRTNLSYQGVSMEQYYEYVNSNRIKLRESYSIQAAEGLKAELVLEAIAKKEEIKVSDDDVEKELEKIAQQNGRSVEELKATLEARGEKEFFKLGLISDRAVDFLVENNSAKKEPTE